MPDAFASRRTLADRNPREAKARGDFLFSAPGMGALLRAQVPP